MIKIYLLLALVATAALSSPISQVDNDQADDQDQPDLKEAGSSAYGSGSGQTAANGNYGDRQTQDNGGSNNAGAAAGAYNGPAVQQQQQQYDNQPWTPTDGQQQQNAGGAGYNQQAAGYGQQQEQAYAGQEQGGYDQGAYGSQEEQYDQSGYDQGGYDQAGAYGGDESQAAYEQGGYDQGAYGQQGQQAYQQSYAPTVSQYNNPPTPQQPEGPAYGQGPAPAAQQPSYGGFQPITAAKATAYTKPLVLEIVQSNAPAAGAAYGAQPAQANYQPAGNAGGYQPAPAPQPAPQPAPAPKPSYNGGARPSNQYGSQQQEQYEPYQPEGVYGGQPELSYKKPTANSNYGNAGYNLDYAGGKPYHGDFTQKPYGTQFPAGLFGGSDYGHQEVNVPFNFGSLAGYGDSSNLDLSALYASGQVPDQAALYGGGDIDSSAAVYGLGGFGEGLKENRYKAAASKLIPNIVRAPFRTIYNALTKSRLLG